MAGPTFEAWVSTARRSVVGKNVGKEGGSLLAHKRGGQPHAAHGSRDESPKPSFQRSMETLADPRWAGPQVSPFQLLWETSIFIM